MAALEIGTLDPSILEQPLEYEFCVAEVSNKTTPHLTLSITPGVPAPSLQDPFVRE